MALTAKVECHCRLTSFSLSIPSASLPLKALVCHCQTCRHTTGQLFATWAVLAEPMPSVILQSGNLASYAVSTCRRWFCKRCGASFFNTNKAGEGDEWEVATGVLSFDDPGGLAGKLERVQIWVEDVQGDAGAVAWINQGKLKGMDRYWKFRGSEMVSDEDVKELTTSQEGEAGDRLLVQCRCQNVSFEIQRPAKDYNGATGKFAAGLDACNSCRRVTGFEITAWATVPKDRIVVDRELDSFLGDRSRLGHYETSTNTSRSFCVTCGATVFYYRHGSDTIDIAMGLLEPKIDGAPRVEAWVTWLKAPEAHLTDETSWKPDLVYREDAVDAKFVQDLAEGMELWSKESRKR